MQLTMNSNEVSVPSDKANRFVSWFNNVANKIATIFTKKERHAVDKELTEAIRAIEWRTRYDQQRIICYIQVASFKKDHPELYKALNISLPVKLLWSDEKANIETTDNSFERKLVRWFGKLNPDTRLLLDGKNTECQRWTKAIVHVPTAPALLPPETVASVQAEPEEIDVVVIDVVAETLPIEETIQQPIEVAPTVKTTKKKAEKKPAKKKIFVKTEKKTKELAHCTIPEMKAFAKRKGFPVPGQITVKNDIQAYITERFNELNNSN